METYKKLCLWLFTSSGLILGEVCSNPSVSTSTHTSRNVALSTETAYVADFTVTCENSMGLNLYAEIEAGVLVPVAYATDTSNYQVRLIVVFCFLCFELDA